MKKSSRLALRITDDLSEVLEKISVLTDVPSSTIIRLALEEYLAKVARERAITIPMKQAPIKFDGFLSVTKDGKTSFNMLTKRK